MTQGDKFYALRLEHHYYNSKYDSGTSTQVLDLDEIDSVISTLKSLKTEMNGNVVNYTEYVYTSQSGLKIGAYYSGGSKLFIRFSSSDTVYFNFDKIDDWIAFFENAQSDIDARK